MDKLRIVLCVGLVACMVGAPDRASAVLKVTISDDTGATILPPPPPAQPPPPQPPKFGTFGGFNLSAVLEHGKTLSMPLLQCKSRPCSIYFPSGHDQPDDPNDRFVFRDNCTAPCTAGFATVTKAESTASNVGQLILDGVLISALPHNVNVVSPNAANRTLWLTYETQPPDMDPVTVGRNSGSFPVGPQLGGSFTNFLPSNGGGNLSQSCEDASLMTPCARIRLVVTGQETSQGKDPVIRSVSIPCDDFDTRNPCSTAAFGYYSFTGAF